MSEQINNKQVFTLYEVTSSIKKSLKERYSKSYWVKAEMNKLNLYPASGHCYPELVEKKNGAVITQLKCNLWSDSYESINRKFISVLNEPLKDGIKILFLATIEFHQVHGLSLNIIDIDPHFTLGDLEREKQETIQKLKTKELFKKNKFLNLSLIPQRIAIISVESSKGYADFLNVINSANVSWNYKFFYMLFPSVLQGDKAVLTMLYQLKKIRQVIHHFDVVAIIRGGGGDIGLSCYNNYELAKEIAQFPIPVITGIGHSTNETVVEMVAYENSITPTKLAEYLIQKYHNVSVPIQKSSKLLIEKSKKIIDTEKAAFQSEIKLFRTVSNSILIMRNSDISNQIQLLIQNSKFLLSNENRNYKIILEDFKNKSKSLIKNNLSELFILKQGFMKDVKTCIKRMVLEFDNTSQNLDNMRPEKVLKRGFSITKLNGKSINNYIKVKPNDTITTTLFKGVIISTVQSSNKNNS